MCVRIKFPLISTIKILHKLRNKEDICLHFFFVRFSKFASYWSEQRNCFYCPSYVPVISLVEGDFDKKEIGFEMAVFVSVLHKCFILGKHLSFRSSCTCQVFCLFQL